MSLMDDFNLDDNLDEFEEESPSEDSGNRTFLLVAGGLGAILILSLACIAIYAMWILPNQRENNNTEASAINAQNTEIAMMVDMTEEARAWTATPSITPTKAPSTATPKPTLVLAPTDTPEMEGDAAADVTADPRTATVAALFTQQANNETTTPQATGLPQTGFVDDVGIPGLVALAGSLVLVIFLARRLRSS